MQLRQIFTTAEDRLSSKRVCGVFGWLVVLVMFVYSVLTQKPIPDFMDIFIWAIVALLGVENITGVFKHVEIGHKTSHIDENENY